MDSSGRVAFVVSTSDCPLESDLLSSTPGIAKSAKEISRCLKLHGFRIVPFAERIDPRRIEKKIAESVKDADEVFFYYLGHGLRKDDELFLSLKKTVLSNLRHSSLRFKEVFSILNSGNAKNILIALDCCHAAKGLTISNKLKSSITCKNAYCIAAAQEHEAAFVHDDGTLFTTCFAEAIEYGPYSIENTSETFSILEVGEHIKKHFMTIRDEGSRAPLVVDQNNGSGNAFRFQKKESTVRIPKEFLRSLVIRSVGVKRKMPRLLNDNLELLGMFCLKQQIWRLSNELDGVKRDIQRWNRDNLHQSGVKMHLPTLYDAMSLSNEIREELSASEQGKWLPLRKLHESVARQLEAFCSFIKRCSDNSESLDDAPKIEIAYIAELEREFGIQLEPSVKENFGDITVRQWCTKLHPLILQKLNNWRNQTNKLWQDCCIYFEDNK